MKEKETKLHCRVNPFGGGGSMAVMLDEPIEEGNAIEEKLYPTAWFLDSELSHISFETFHSLNENKYNFKPSPYDVGITYKNAGGKEKLVALLRKYRDDAVKSGDYGQKNLI